jgi:hypothetical protein
VQHAAGHTARSGAELEPHREAEVVRG